MDLSNYQSNVQFSDKTLINRHGLMEKNSKISEGSRERKCILMKIRTKSCQIVIVVEWNHEKELTWLNDNYRIAWSILEIRRSYSDINYFID